MLVPQDGTNEITEVIIISQRVSNMKKKKNIWNVNGRAEEQRAMKQSEQGAELQQ